MLTFEISKREEKKAKQKLHILSVFLKEMESNRLTDLHIDQVCQIIGISKVTFFNYFNSKEEIALYFIQLWQYEMNYEIKERDLKGRDIIIYLFTKVSSHPSASSIMNALMTHFLKIKTFIPMEVSDYEFYLYNEKAYTRGYRGIQLYDMVGQAIGQMGLDQEAGNHVMTHIMSGFYGIPFIQNLGFGHSMENMYLEYLNKILPEEVSYE